MTMSCGRCDKQQNSWGYQAEPCGHGQRRGERFRVGKLEQGLCDTPGTSCGHGARSIRFQQTEARTINNNGTVDLKNQFGKGVQWRVS